MKAKMNKIELIRRIQEVLASHTNDPVTELRTMGQAFIDIADALEGKSTIEAQATLKAVAAMEGINL